MRYIFCITLLLFGNLSYSQGGCVGGNVTTLSPTINYGNSTTLTLNVPAGSFQWQYSSNNSDWSNVTSGTVSNTNNYPPINFSYTGALQTFVVPAGITSINVEGVGAAGGHGNSDNNGTGGKGGRLIADLNTTPGETLYLHVGGKGKAGSNYTGALPGQGGYNGGGNAPTVGGGGGGGATDIRQGGDDLANRIFVVGGGGGGGQQLRFSVPGGDGGNGGGETGGNGSDAPIGSGRLGYGGTQISGGAAGIPSGFTDDATPGQLGIGGNGGRYWNTTANRVGGGGGGGYYGGGGGTNGKDGGGGGGGGGSSYSNSGNITTNNQGDASATGDGALILSYESETPYSITSNYTTSPTSPTYYRAVVTDGACVAYSTSTLISVNLDLIITNPLATLTSCLGSSSTPTTFGIAGSGLTESVTITAPLNFEISTISGGGYSSSITLTNTNTVSQTLYIRLKSSATVGSKTGTITITSTGVSDATISISGTVSLPNLSISGTTTNIDLVSLTASGGTTYAWSDGSSPSSATNTFDASGLYSLTVTDANGCVSSTNLNITVQQWGLSSNGEKILDSALQINAYGQIASINPLTSDGKKREYKRRLSVGDSYGGGIVAYIFQPADAGYVAGQQHGLIISNSFSGIGDVVWGTGAVSETSQEIGSGSTNTGIIIDAIGSNSAAGLARSHRAGGYTDWYLPSLKDLQKIYFNINRIPSGSNLIGGPSKWSSTSSGLSTAGAVCYCASNLTEVQIASSFTGLIDSRSSLYRVHPVRNF
jgi:hypothetical protein